MLTRTNPADTLSGDAPTIAPVAGAVEGMPSALDLGRLVRILRWRLKLIIAVVLATVALAIGAVTLLPAKYRATTIILLDPREPKVTDDQQVISGIGADAAAVESQVELIQSSALAAEVIRKLDLESDPELTSASPTERIKAKLMGLLGRPPPPAAEPDMNALVGRFESHLTVDRRGLTYILEIAYSANDPAKAARIANAVADAYLDDQRRSKGDLTAQASDWLSDRIAEMRERLRKSEEAVADYKTAHGIVDLTQGNNLVARQIENVTQQMALAGARMADAEARLKQVEEAQHESRDPAATSQVLQSPVIANLRAQYAEAARLEAQYAGIYGPKHPALIAAEEQLASISRQIDDEVGRQLAGVRNDYTVASGQVATLQDQLAKLQTQSDSQGQADVALGELEREAQANRTLFEQFLARVKETDEQQSLQLADARIVAPALVPVAPQRPGLPLVLIAALACGSIFGVGLVLLLEQLRRAIRTPAEAEQWFGVSGLGILPRQSRGGRRRLGPGTPDRGAARYAVSFPLSDYAASLWAIATRLRRMAPRRGSEIIVIASALPGEGKSTFAANLALASAASGVRTLLVDGDIYAATVSRAFGLAGPGLAEVTSGAIDFATASARDAATGLALLGARAGTHAEDDLDGEAVAALLDRLRGEFELIVVDSPAILPVDGGGMIEAADRAVMVVEWDRTDRNTVADAIALLGGEQRKLQGIVLNNASPRWYRLFSAGRYLKSYGGLALPAATPAKIAA